MRNARLKATLIQSRRSVAVFPGPLAVLCHKRFRKYYKLNFPPQDFQICSVRDISCYTAVPRYFASCGVSCKGDRYKKGSIAKNRQKLVMLLEEYKSYKEKFERNIKFNPKLAYLSKYT